MAVHERMRKMRKKLIFLWTIALVSAVLAGPSLSATAQGGGAPAQLPPDDGNKFQFLFVFDNGAVAAGSWDGGNEVDLHNFSNDINPGDLSDTTHISCSDDFGFGNNNPDGWGEKGSPDINNDPGWHLSGVQIRKDGNLCVDGGVITPTGEIGDFVWIDGDGDGIQDGNESGTNGVTVELLDANMNPIDSRVTANHPVTAAPGWYLFDGLQPGTYFVRFVLPAGFEFTLQDQGGDDSIDSDAKPDAPDQGKTAAIDLSAGESDLTWDAGLVRPGVQIVKCVRADTPTVTAQTRISGADCEPDFGTDANDPNGADVPVIAPGTTVIWTYLVENTGSQTFPAGAVSVTDSFPGVNPVFVSGDDGDGLFEPGEVWVYQATGPALDLGDPANANATVDGCRANPDQTDPERKTYKNVGTVEVPGDTDTDEAHYCNPPPSVDIEKATNGNDADGANDSDVPVLTPGDTVTWTYLVTNTGVVSIPLADVTVTDSIAGVNPVFDPTSDAGNDGILSPGEVWIYTAQGTVDDLGALPPEPPVVNGCSNVPTQGDPNRATYENIGTVQVPGDSDSDPSHYCNPPPEVDNIDLALSKSVSQSEVDVGAQVTFTVTVTNEGLAGASGVTVSDALPSGLSYVSDNGVGSFDSDTLVWTVGSLAAGASASLDFVVTATTAGTFTNVAQVATANEPDVDSTPGNSVPAEDDQDDATVTATEVAASAQIGDFVWLDTDKDGKQDPGEKGIANATVNITNVTPANAGQSNVVPPGLTDTVKTDANGLYLFAGLDAGTYRVDVVTGSVAINLALTTVGTYTVTLVEGQSFLDADFGFGEVLPVTGFASLDLGVWGMALLLAGSFVVLASRRLRREAIGD